MVDFKGVPRCLPVEDLAVQGKATWDNVLQILRPTLGMSLLKELHPLIYAYIGSHTHHSLFAHLVDELKDCWFYPDQDGRPIVCYNEVGRRVTARYNVASLYRNFHFIRNFHVIPRMPPAIYQACHSLFGRGGWPSDKEVNDDSKGKEIFTFKEVEDFFTTHDGFVEEIYNNLRAFVICKFLFQNHRENIREFHPSFIIIDCRRCEGTHCISLHEPLQLCTDEQPLPIGYFERTFNF